MHDRRAHRREITGASKPDSAAQIGSILSKSTSQLLSVAAEVIAKLHEIVNGHIHPNLSKEIAP